MKSPRRASAGGQGDQLKNRASATIELILLQINFAGCFSKLAPPGGRIRNCFLYASIREVNPQLQAVELAIART